MLCLIEGCDTELVPPQKKRCKEHVGQCIVPGCKKKPPERWSRCSMHAQRMKYHGSYGGPDSTMRAKGTGTDWAVNKDGYVERSLVKARVRTRELQHRVVMAEVIGRPLLSHETPHHKNGVRSDNRPENLELWVKSQPAGQRAVDLLAWAREVIETYEPLEDKL